MSLINLKNKVINFIKNWQDLFLFYLKGFVYLVIIGGVVIGAIAIYEKADIDKFFYTFKVGKIYSIIPCYVYKNKNTYNLHMQMKKTGDFYGVKEITDKDLFLIQDSPQVLILEKSVKLRKIRILSGLYQGEAFWIHYKDIVVIAEAKKGKYLFLRYFLASVFWLYWIVRLIIWVVRKLEQKE